MSNGPEPLNPPLSDDEEASPADALDDNQAFADLDRYVEAMHRLDEGQRAQFLEDHPDLLPLLACLDTLDSIAPVPVAPVPVAPEPDDVIDSIARTVLSSSDEVSETGVDILGITPVHPNEFGKYELQGELGRGGMGVVYKARQTDLDRIVALKMILSSQFASKEEVRRFYAEARAAGSLQHPNIIAIHEVGELHGQHYFAMDFVEGQNLAQILRDGPIDVDRAAEFIQTIARAADFLHNHGIIHRDLKPANILVDESGVPHLTDFGLAKLFDTDSHQTRSGTIIGTPSYMSPEQASGRISEISPRSDVYSLGTILYELLTGRPPFREDNPLDTLVQVIEGEATLPVRINRRVPRELELICMRCLEKEPNDRYQTAADLADDLDRFLKREPVAARPSGWIQKLRRWTRREPALVSRWGGLAVAMGVTQLNYAIRGVDFEYFIRIMGVLGVWAVACFIFQRLLNREGGRDLGQFGWAAADPILLTTVLCLADGPLGPLLVGYPLLVASSGMFFRVRLVWFATFMNVLSFAALVKLRLDEFSLIHYAAIFALVLTVVGFIVAHQVYRVRVLSRFYDRRSLP